MIIKPRIKGFVCITSHPIGCLENVRQQADLASKISLEEGKGPKKVLVIGASTGYGLSSRISAAFSNNATTLGVSFENRPRKKSPVVLAFTIFLHFRNLQKSVV